ncbi:MAG TPA: TlyA family RNA methyltransferase [Egicoccus sp.]|nr:TlyA family RNA methyltransferase [Egicoccus sp.]HSK24934.1 TlyA family RNA methyltransferase [Egicoccus sp.]
MTVSPARRRLDAELVRRDLASSRTEAQEAIAAGLVTVDGAPALKPSTQVHAGQALVVAGPPRRFVSRGGEKLSHALEVFGVDPSGRRCLDAGVSTGGFTDCLLQRGAVEVLAYDVGYGQVHEKIRQDARVVVHERTNVRDLLPADLPHPLPDLFVADLSFISLAGVLPVLRPLVSEPAEGVVLVKPQFEAQRDQVGKGGVVRDPDVWRQCLVRVADSARSLGWGRLDVTASPLLGPAGNVEFLMHLQLGAVVETSFDEAVVRAVAAGLDRRRAGART